MVDAFSVKEANSRLEEALEKDKVIVEQFWDKLSLIDKMYCRCLYATHRFRKNEDEE